MYAQAPVLQISPSAIPRSETMLSKAVVRITGTVEGLDGIVNGTGFIVAIPEPRLPGNLVVPYLVTNRHVA